MTLRIDNIPRDLLYGPGDVFVAFREDAAVLVTERGHPAVDEESTRPAQPWAPRVPRLPALWPVPPPPLPVLHPVTAPVERSHPVTLSSGDVALLTADRGVRTSIGALWARMQAIMSRPERPWNQNMADLVTLLQGLPLAAAGSGELDAGRVRHYLGLLAGVRPLLHDYGKMLHRHRQRVKHAVGLRVGSAVSAWAELCSVHKSLAAEKDGLREYMAKVMWPGMARRGQDISWPRMVADWIETAGNVVDSPEAAEKVRRAAEALEVPEDKEEGEGSGAPDTQEQ